MIDLEKSYGLPPHTEQEPFGLGDRVRVRPFPNPHLLPVLNTPSGIVLETRMNVVDIVAYQQIRLEDGWTASYWWELDQ